MYSSNTPDEFQSVWGHMACPRIHLALPRDCVHCSGLIYIQHQCWGDTPAQFSGRAHAQSCTRFIIGLFSPLLPAVDYMSQVARPADISANNGRRGDRAVPISRAISCSDAEGEAWADPWSIPLDPSVNIILLFYFSLALDPSSHLVSATVHESTVQLWSQAKALCVSSALQSILQPFFCCLKDWHMNSLTMPIPHCIAKVRKHN